VVVRMTSTFPPSLAGANVTRFAGLIDDACRTG
jgi:hypothetical protein